MTLEDDTQALASIGSKGPGLLVRSDDWNGLIGSVIAIRDAVLVLQAEVSAVNQTVANLEGVVTTLDARTTAVENGLEQLRGNVRPLLDQYRVVLQTTRVSYAMGELAELTATATDLNGNPLDLSGIENPWIDFVSSWGRLRAVSGFNSRAGTGDNSLSVQVNDQGIARVRLRTEHSEALSEADELQVSNALQEVVPVTAQPMWQTFLGAATPTDSQASSAYQLVNTQYELGNTPMRSFLDTYLAVNQPPQATFNILPLPTFQWRDYRSTVMAFVKNDSDPTTPDPARAVSSIQITFRDWVGPWLNGYLADVGPLADNFRASLVPNITFDYAGTIGRFQDEVFAFNENTGLVGRQRNYRAIDLAVDQMELTQPPVFFNDLVTNVQNSVRIQQSVDVAGVGAGTGANAAFFAFTNTASQLAGLDNVVTEVQTTVEGVSTSMDEVGASVTNLNSRLNNAESVGLNIQTTLGNIEDNVQSINVLSADTLQGSLQLIGSDIGLIRSLLNQ